MDNFIDVLFWVCYQDPLIRIFGKQSKVYSQLRYRDFLILTN